jgi:pimeloyl-ACP methyl ester carboxylesterase
MRRRFIRSASTIGLIGLLTACTSASPGTSVGPASTAPAPTGSAGSGSIPSAPAPSATSTDLLADFDVGGRTMHILCVGPTDTGKPTVIFESGLGGDAGQWSDVIHELDGRTRACAYDRAGNGSSQAATVGRTTKDQVTDLRALLAAAKVAPPYVLVGHSLGGWNVMVHADDYPDDVVGAVMVDVRPPAASREWLKALPPESPTESEAIKMARDESTTFDTDPTLNPEGLRLGDSADQAIATKGFGSKPLIVLAAADTAGLAEGFEPALGATLVKIWWDLQDELASRSTTGRLLKVENSTHEMPGERPDAIADAIREVLGS